MVFATGCFDAIGIGPTDDAHVSTPDTAVIDLLADAGTADLSDLAIADLGAPDQDSALPDFALIDLAHDLHLDDLAPLLHDLGAPADLVTPDLATPDLAIADLAVPDLAVPDLATPDLVVLLPAPQVSSVAPPSGPTSGGSKLKVLGDHFVSGARVTLGAADATNVVFVSSTTLTADSPAGPPGTVDVTVINPDGQSGAEKNAFTWIGTFGLATVAPAASVCAGALMLAGGDINHDGKNDLVVTCPSNNNMAYLIGKGDGTFIPVAPFATGSGPYGVTSGDWDGDGNVDFAVANQGSSNLSVFYGENAGGLTPALAGGNPNNFQIVSGDMNKDGIADFVYTGSAQTGFVINFGKGSRGFQSNNNIPITNSPTLFGLTLGDLDEDGQLDVAIADTAGGGSGLRIWSSMFGELLFGAGTSPACLVAADFDQDGHLDLALTDTVNSNVHILNGNGKAGFNSGPSPGVGNQPIGIAVGDLDNDGNLDLVTGNETDKSISVLLGSANGTFPIRQDFTAGAAPQYPLLIDLNGDGLLDIAIANTASGVLSIFLNQTK